MAIVDSRYARAFAAVVLEQKLDQAAALAQLNDFAATFEQSGDLRKVLDAIAARMGMSGAVRNFVAVITHHGRLRELREILASYAALADEETGIAEAEIITARPLDDAGRNLMEQQVAKLTGGQKVRATYSEDATLLGGAVVKLGSTVYDGSVRAQLQQLKQRLVAAQV
jgi:F-type H+-transporting ATPase subunit delta